MPDIENLQLFENQLVRTAWNEAEEELSQQEKPEGFEQNQDIARRGGSVVAHPS